MRITQRCRVCSSQLSPYRIGTDPAFSAVAHVCIAVDSTMTLSAKQLAQSRRRRERLVEICRTLAEVNYEMVGDGHIAFRLGKKTFAYYLFDHHGDGIVAFCCKSSLSEQRRLIRDDSESFFVPAYLGAKRWIAIRLDLDDVDWDTVNELARQAFQLIAPRKLAALVEI